MKLKNIKHFSDLWDVIRFKGPTAAKVIWVATTLSFLHFSAFVIYFDRNITVLFEIGGIVRFFMSNLFFYGLILAVVRVGMFVLTGPEPPLLAKWAREALEQLTTREIDYSWMSMVFAHAMASPIFLLVYLGISNFFIFLIYSAFLFIIVLPIILFFRWGTRDAARSTQSKNNVEVKAYLVSFLIFASVVSGNLRADQISKTQRFEISHIDLNTKTESMITTSPHAEKSGDGGGQAHTLRVSIFLSSSRGFFAKEIGAERVLFVPWDASVVISVSEEDRSNFSIRPMFKKFQQNFLNQTE